MKKTLALILASSLVFGALCSCGKNSDSSNTSSIASEAEMPYSVTITSDDVDGPTALPIAYEFVDGESSVEIYYISFGCNVDGVTIERIDMDFQVTESLFRTQTIKQGSCLKLTTNTPEGFPNMRISVTCGENEYTYLLSYNGRDGGANLIDEQEIRDAMQSSDD